MNFFLINFRDANERFCGAMDLRAPGLAEACMWARGVMLQGHHALIWDSDDKLLCVLPAETSDRTIH